VTWSKIDLPVDKVRACLELGPIVLVSSAWKGERNVMTLGWRTMIEFTVRRARRPKNPTTLHYTGDGIFFQSGRIVSRRSDFSPALLGRGR